MYFISGYTKQSSSIVVIGLNIHTAPVEVREKFAIAESDWPRAINELCSLNHIEEAAVLSTCNRIEIYVLALSQTRGVKEVTEWMSKVLIILHLSLKLLSIYLSPFSNHKINIKFSRVKDNRNQCAFAFPMN